MFCPNCGDNVSPNQKFCTSCGNKLETNSTNTSATHNNQSSNYTNSTASEFDINTSPNVNNSNTTYKNNNFTQTNSNNNNNSFTQANPNNNNNFTETNLNNSNNNFTPATANNSNFKLNLNKAKLNDILNTLKLKVKSLTKKQLVIIAAVLVVIIGFSIVRASNVNSSSEKVTKNFFTALDDVNYKKMEKCFYKPSSDDLAKIDMRSESQFAKTANDLKRELEKEYGKDWLKQLHYEVSKDYVYVSIPNKTSHNLTFPIISVDNKYYIDITSFRF